jgi:serine/threonine protein kinase
MGGRAHSFVVCSIGYMGLEPARMTDFQVTGPLGVGSTARVMAAVHLASGRHVAIKILEPSPNLPELRERVAREALLLAGVQSRHVGRILGFGFEQGQPFLVLERLGGETLDAKLRRDGPVPLRLALYWLEQVLLGVRDIHAAQVVHRDLKPSNIFVQQEEHGQLVKLIDFGVARVIEAAGSAGLTSANHLIGSMGYMAPEQFHSPQHVSFPADLYACGVVIFRSITGQLPFIARSLEQIIELKLEQPAPLLSSAPGAPNIAMLDAIVARALERDPTDRFGSAREMLEHLSALRHAVEQAVLTGVPLPAQALPPVDRAPPTRSFAQDPPIVASPAIDDAPHPGDEPDHTIPDSHAPVFDAADHLAAQQAAGGGGPISITDVTDTPEPTSVNSGASHGSTEWDIPTRSDNNLKALVDRELAKARVVKKQP